MGGFGLFLGVDGGTLNLFLEILAYDGSGESAVEIKYLSGLYQGKLLQRKRAIHRCPTNHIADGEFPCRK